MRLYDEVLRYHNIEMGARAVILVYDQGDAQGLRLMIEDLRHDLQRED